jgi:hypothetical protein
MRSLSQSLNALILVVEDTLTKPARYQSIARNPAFPDLAAEIRAHDARPSEHKRCTYFAMAAVYMLEALYACDTLEADSPILSPIGGVLPFLRGDAWQALLNEKAQPSTEGYRR